MKCATFLIAAAAIGLATPAAAGPDQFSKGPVITASGAVTKVDSDVPLPPGMDWKMDFNVPSAQAGKLNPRIDAAARFINMLAASGVPMSKIHAAVVLHSQGLMDVLNDTEYSKESDGAPNPNAAVIKQLIAKGVPVYVCGQSAELSDIRKADVIPGVKFALSAMTVHAMLQSQGYTINP
jgi:intracellular sulfur oxidation DsrE/DsrF family protein